MRRKAGRRMRPAAALALAVLILGGGAWAEELHIHYPWREAVVVVPAPEGFILGRMNEKLVLDRLSRLPAGKKFPAVLYLHGCSGVAPENFDYIHLLAGEGYAVVAPDSFARPDRPETCDPKRYAGVLGAPQAEVNRMRREEIQESLEHLRRLPWVDQRNIFLMGHSQGGGAASSYSGGGFRGVILSGSLCPSGLNAPAGTPVLALYSKRDPWLQGRDPRSCEARGKERGLPIEFHLFPGNFHNQAKNPQARELILDFLRRHTEPSARMTGSVR
ncbi:MAG: alpha/beta fold hydrolase [Candidatus Tectomicrobia bacterium]|uniref:Alpha/beta fold hydrolase n=1 Tax=Tectimicrobiota bacterium TaxID=2528274 RepID=A0A932I282_UNCTE|nr:alpha/beta fold hydrolase [Candidatus Tectomicrobia bacterium]